MRKKLLSFLLAFCMILSACVTLGVTSFAVGDALTAQDITDTVNAKTGTININSQADWNVFAAADKAYTYEGVTVKLNADITVNAEMDALAITAETDTSALTKWTPIAEFKGTFDGNGKTVKGLYIDGAGFFAKASGTVNVQNVIFENCYAVANNTNSALVIAQVSASAVVSMSNVTLKDCYLNHTNNNNAGALIGNSAGKILIDGCSVSGIVKGVNAAATGNLRVGGLVGMLTNDASTANSSIRNSANHATLICSAVCGGIIGNARGTNFLIESCHNTGAVQGGASYQTGNTFAAGILGQQYLGNTTISNCTNSGAITLACKKADIGGNGDAGGIVGNVGGGPVALESCVNTAEGTVTGTGRGTAGILAYGSHKDITIRGCANFAECRADEPLVQSRLGGIVGQSWNIITLMACANFGDLTGVGGAYDSNGTTKYREVWTGGLIGHASNTVTAKDCLSAGDVSGYNKTAGLVGYYVSSVGSFENCIVTGKVHVVGDEYSNGAFIAQFKVANTDASKYITIKNCYYLAGLCSTNKNANNFDSAMTQWVDMEGGAPKAQGNIRVIYDAVDVDFTFVAGVTNAAVTGGMNHQKFYNAMFNDPTNENYTGACVATVAELSGMAGISLLTKAGYDFANVWTPSAGVPVPVAEAMVEGTVNMNAAVVYKGYQEKIVDGDTDTLSLRLVAGLNDLYYANTGFELYILTEDGMMTTAEAQNTDTVYTSLSVYSAEGGLEDPISAESLGCAYLSAIAIDTLPAVGNVKLLAAPYVTNGDTTVSYGSTVVLVIENGEIVDQYAI
ncbi:MAG: hypothetical protein E7668_04465 [Ruminococcaceae bacterium]|nr:hypothetical protein [Oscillospiraceae bacterium]